ncbi:MAG: DUF547 domain-containing protein [Pseudomonadota bacterium]
MKTVFTSAVTLALIAGTGLTAPLAAKGSDSATTLQSSSTQRSGTDAFARFTPAADRKNHRIDYTHWDEALEWFVIPMGPSIREAPATVTPELGTRIVYGHRSRYRLEGNRVAFSFLNGDIKTALTEYRQDLERVGSQLDIARLPRNEQLAFWINLHNVAVIEALANEYPMRQPSKREFGSNNATLQDAKLVTISGVSLSPRDIREKIVYPNWNDPRVIYAFWRGEIGGPSIQRLAYTGANVGTLLSLNAEEFVNSLRGVDSYSGALRVSRLYEEAKPFYFANDDELKAHLLKFARDDVKELIRERPRVRYATYERDIADMLLGRGDPGLTFSCNADNSGLPLSSGAGDLDPAGTCKDIPVITNRAAQRLMVERAQKLNKAYRRGIRTGTVTFDDPELRPGAAPKEVE